MFAGSYCATLTSRVVPSAFFVFFGFVFVLFLFVSFFFFPLLQCFFLPPVFYYCLLIKVAALEM